MLYRHATVLPGQWKWKSTSLKNYQYITNPRFVPQNVLWTRNSILHSALCLQFLTFFFFFLNDDNCTTGDTVLISLEMKKFHEFKEIILADGKFTTPWWTSNSFESTLRKYTGELDNETPCVTAQKGVMNKCLQVASGNRWRLQQLSLTLKGLLVGSQIPQCRRGQSCVRLFDACTPHNVALGKLTRLGAHVWCKTCIWRFKKIQKFKARPEITNKPYSHKQVIKILYSDILQVSKWRTFISSEFSTEGILISVCCTPLR